MYTVSNALVTGDDFLMTNESGASVARMSLVYTFIDRMKTSEVILPAERYPHHGFLTLEMSAYNWWYRQKSASSELLPWLSLDPGFLGLSGDLRIEYSSSNRRHAHLLPLKLLPGEYDETLNLFRIYDAPYPTTGKLDLLIRRQYGPSMRYHGITDDEAESRRLPFFRRLPCRSQPESIGIEYWVVSINAENFQSAIANLPRIQSIH